MKTKGCQIHSLSVWFEKMFYTLIIYFYSNYKNILLSLMEIMKGKSYFVYERMKINESQIFIDRKKMKKKIIIKKSNNKWK